MTLILSNNKNRYHINKQKRRFKWRKPTIPFFVNSVVKPFRRKRWLHFQYLRVARRVNIFQNKYKYRYINYLVRLDKEKYKHKQLYMKQKIFHYIKKNIFLLKQYLLSKKLYLQFRLTKNNYLHWFMLNWLFKTSKNRYKYTYFLRNKYHQKHFNKLNKNRYGQQNRWNRKFFRKNKRWNQKFNTKNALFKYTKFNRQKNLRKKKLFFNKAVLDAIKQLKCTLFTLSGFKPYTRIRWIKNFAWRSFWNRKQRRRIFYKKFFSQRKKFIYYRFQTLICQKWAKCLHQTLKLSQSRQINFQLYVLYLKFKYFASLKQKFVRIEQQHLKKIYNFCWSLNKKQFFSPLRPILLSIQKIFGYINFKKQPVKIKIFNTIVDLVNKITKYSKIKFNYRYIQKIWTLLIKAKNNNKFLKVTKYKKRLIKLIRLFMKTNSFLINKKNQNNYYLKYKKQKNRSLRRLLAAKRRCFKLNMFYTQKSNTKLPFFKKRKFFHKRKKFTWFEQGKFIERKQKRYKYKRQSRLLRHHQYNYYKTIKTTTRNRKYQLLSNYFIKYLHNKQNQKNFKNFWIAKAIPRLLQNKKHSYYNAYNEKIFIKKYWWNNKLTLNNSFNLINSSKKKNYFFPHRYYQPVFFSMSFDRKKIIDFNTFSKFKISKFFFATYKKSFYYYKKKSLKQNKKLCFQYIRQNNNFKQMLKKKYIPVQKIRTLRYWPRWKFKKFKKNLRWKHKRMRRAKKFNSFKIRCKKIKTIRYLKTLPHYTKPLKTFFFKTLINRQLQNLIKNPNKKAKYTDTFKELFFARWFVAVYNKKEQTELLYNTLLKKNSEFLNFFKSNPFIFIKQLNQLYSRKFFKHRNKLKYYQTNLQLQIETLYKKTLKYKYKTKAKKMFILYKKLKFYCQKLKNRNNKLYKKIVPYIFVKRKKTNNKKISFKSRITFFFNKSKKHKTKKLLDQMYAAYEKIKEIKKSYKKPRNKKFFLIQLKLRKLLNLYTKLKNKRLSTRQYWLKIRNRTLFLRKFKKFERVLSNSLPKMTRLKRQAFICGTTFYNVYKSFTNFFRYQLISTKKRNYFTKKIFINFLYTYYKSFNKNKNSLLYLLKIIKINTEQTFSKNLENKYAQTEVGDRLSKFYIQHRKRFNRYRSLQLYSKYRFNKRLFINRHSRLRFGLTHFLRKWKRLQSIYAQKKFIVKFFLQEYYNGLNPTEFYKLRSHIKYKNNKLVHWHNRIENRADILLSKLKLSSNLWLSRYLITSKKVFFNNNQQTRTTALFKSTPFISVSTQPTNDLFITEWQNKTNSIKFHSTPLSFYHKTNEIEQFLNYTTANHLQRPLTNHLTHSNSSTFNLYKTTLKKRQARIHRRVPFFKKIRRLFYFKKNTLKKKYKKFKKINQTTFSNLTNKNYIKNWQFGAPKVSVYRTRKNNKGLFANLVSHNKYRTNYNNIWYTNYLLSLQHYFLSTQTTKPIYNYINTIMFFNPYILAKIKQPTINNTTNKLTITNNNNAILPAFNLTKNITAGTATNTFNTWRRNFELKLHRRFRYRGRKRPRILRTKFTKLRNNTLLTYDFLNFLRFNKI